MSEPLGDLLAMLKGVDDVPQLRRDLAAALTRAARAKAKIQAVLDLLSDPAESHRMLTRKEIGRLLR